MEEHYAAVREKKEAKRKKKLDHEEEERRAEEERARLEEQRAKAEKKALRKKLEKQKADEMRAEMQKDMHIQLAIQVSELEDHLVQRVHQVIAPAPPPNLERGKKKVTYVSEEVPSSTEEGSDTSVTQELSVKTQRLAISEKRKRGPEPVFEEVSPPMELPAKRTPQRGILKPVKLSGRLTRSKSKKAGGGLTPTSTKKKIATPLSKRRTPTSAKTPVLTPSAKSSLERMCYRDSILRELKDLDATELQHICREEGIHYDKKVDAIFDIADHRTEVAFSNPSTVAEEVIRIADSEGTAAGLEETPAVDE
ncbi:hypothetical protein CBR_g24368 [Chara braunii]|uniref:Uncharacterized protein n=1 Tax=Chara braunii TaxID=69332 RepID=A0A388JMG6_CHABU|nr:hypothetical protein CBR_g24368 [Chara braunii]|eukprot:GBG59020.1 hypothetical protein CBR_g24368 [Chara braunii]